jgi:hypothetical protein
MTGLLEAFLPSIGVGLIFYIGMRFIVRADRNERKAVAALENEPAPASGAEIPKNSGISSDDAPRSL